ncbi:hypothetical protein PybrP1_008859 [[Pythium] brassicae (nom. inval.)]|nr:hypothetical protein PybrP1_008859 [[Pythium] brassicae (nom. inval.)]
MHPTLHESFCGGAAAAVNIVVTFPPNKVMFRQQLYGLTTRDALMNVQHEGILMLYRGLAPPLMQATVSKAIMFGLYDWCDDVLARQFGDSTGVQLLAAGISGAAESVLAPFETPKFNSEFDGAYAAMRQLHQFGVREHFRGISAILLRNGPGGVLFFGLREPLRDAFPAGGSPAAKSVGDFVCGALLGAGISTLSFPINVAKTRMQSVVDAPHMSVWQALRLTYVERDRSLWRVYRGVATNFCRSLISWGILNSTYEKLKAVI